MLINYEVDEKGSLVTHCPRFSTIKIGSTYCTSTCPHFNCFGELPKTIRCSHSWPLQMQTDKNLYTLKEKKKALIELINSDSTDIPRFLRMFYDTQIQIDNYKEE